MTSPRLSPGQLETIAPHVRRLVANNAGFMTGPGTNTYILGRERYVVIDPGPDDDTHLERILSATGGTIDTVLVTHTHGDHSPGARTLAARTGARLAGRPAPSCARQDATFVPHRVLEDGDTVEADELRLRALHTPGHASNHLCYLIEDSGLLFTGDHLIQGSTVVIAPPDGSMHEYLRSLERLQREPVTRLAPGHGSVIDAAQEEIARIIAHRLQREAKVVDKLRQYGPTTIEALVPRVYDDVDARLHPLATSSLLAHLMKLQLDGRATCDRNDDWQIKNDGDALD